MLSKRVWHRPGAERTWVTTPNPERLTRRELDDLVAAVVHTVDRIRSDKNAERRAARRRKRQTPIDRLVEALADRADEIGYSGPLDDPLERPRR